MNLRYIDAIFHQAMAFIDKSLYNLRPRLTQTLAGFSEAQGRAGPLPCLVTPPATFAWSGIC